MAVLLSSRHAAGRAQVLRTMYRRLPGPSESVLVQDCNSPIAAPNLEACLGPKQQNQIPKHSLKYFDPPSPVVGGVPHPQPAPVQGPSSQRIEA